jgi:ribitol-5-phosphate 2-dehydrogenase (NADP+) / D-ribitol-5-phosphate cytidylyltransferase
MEEHHVPDTLPREQLPAIAVVLAGGTGSRVGLDLPKQLLKVAGKPILAHTLELFESSDDISEIILLMAPGWLEEAKVIVETAGLTKVRAVLEGGGPTRNDTTKIAIDTLAGLGLGECKVLLHDAVRPLVDHRIVTDCVRALDHFDAVDTAIPSADTIVVVDGPASRTGDGAIIKEIPSRSRLMRGQTPQAFLLSTLQAAYTLAGRDPAFTATDDCSVVLRYLPDVPIYVVAGSEQNMKITYPIDVFLADQLFRLASAPPPSLGDERMVELLHDKVIVVFGGSYGIGADIAELAERHGAQAVRLSRSGSGLHIEDPRATEDALAKVHAEFGRIDHVVVTAGVLHTVELATASDDVVDETIGVNLLGPIYAARAAHRYLRESNGQLLLFTSSSYTRGRSGYSLYSATKAAIVNLTQALADEWSADGIRVNCVNPERTATPMRAKAFGTEPPNSLLSSDAVAQASLEVLLSGQTGNVIDVRREPDNGRSSSPVAAALSDIQAAAAAASTDDGNRP